VSELPLRPPGDYPPGVAGRLAWQELERHQPAELQILGLVDDPHPPAAKAFENSTSTAAPVAGVTPDRADAAPAAGSDATPAPQV
jgi:hypothetical protein